MTSDLGLGKGKCQEREMEEAKWRLGNGEGTERGTHGREDAQRRREARGAAPHISTAIKHTQCFLRS